MIFCLGMIVKEGIVGVADSRPTSGNEIISAKKTRRLKLCDSCAFLWQGIPETAPSHLED